MKENAWLAAGLLFLLSCTPDERSAPPAARSTPVSPDSGHALAGAAPAPASGDCEPVWPDPVHLTGTLVKTREYGPPGYGETPQTDERLTIYYIDLAHPKDICAGMDGNQRTAAIPGIRRMQLKGSVDVRLLRRELGHLVVADGTLQHRVWGTDFTPVVLMVDSMRPMGTPAAPPAS